MADSFVSDLNTAANMFVQGTQQLALNSGINNAQKQIADINASQQDEIAKREAASKVAQNLVLDLTKSGQNIGAISQAFGAIAPKDLSTSNAMQAEALAKNSPELAAAAQTQQKFEEDPKQALERTKGRFEVAKAEALSGRKQATAQDKSLQSTQQLLESARGNPAAAQAEKDIYAADKAKSLVNMYGDPNKLSMPQVHLLAAEIGKIAAGGATTQSELQAITPDTLKGRMSKYVSNLTNNPTPANAGAFVKQFQDYSEALTKDAQKVIQDKYGRIIESRKGQLGDTNYKALQDNYINRFKNNQAPSGEGSAAAASPAPAQAPLQTVRLHDGSIVKGRYLPNGQFQTE